MRLPILLACVVAGAVAACGRLAFETLVIEPADAGVGESDGGDASGSTDAFGSEGDSPAGSFDSRAEAAASVDVQAAKDAKPDAGPELGDCVRVQKTWNASFDNNPTTSDVNKDGFTDWSDARGSFAPNQLKNSQWRPSASVALLDTAPLSDFSTRTLMSLYMQHLEFLYPQTNNLGGAIAWLNLDNQTNNGIAVYLRLVRVSPTEQTLYLMANSASAPLATFTVDGGLQELTLDADPTTAKARLWLGNAYKGEWDLPRTGKGPNRDAFATVGTFFGSSVFDEVIIEQCAP